MAKEGLIVDICSYIDEHIKEDIRIDDIASTFYFDRFYLMKLFKKETGTTIVDYINKKRVRNSMPPLAYTNDKILKIALNNGFNSLEYYSEQFTKIVGISPVNFRKLASVKDVSPYFEMGDNDMNKLDVIRKNISDLQVLKAEMLALKATPKTLSNENVKVLKKAA